MSKWIIDPQHSDIHFKARHMVISTVTGMFKTFEGTVVTSGDDFKDAKIKVMVDAASIDTNNANRDHHLREEDFFNVAKFPKVEFESISLTLMGDNEYKLTGLLTIKTGTKRVELKVTSGGTGTDAQGKLRAGFEVSGSINRYDFGLVWTLLSEAGAIILGEEVQIHANIELIKDSDQV